ncbi:anion exchange protein, partial [Aphelenchoides avenae]
MMYLSTETDEDEEEAAGPQLFWHQVARWIKYEQDVEGDGTRFSKPHITLLSLHALLQIKNCVRKGVVLLDAEASSFVQLCSVMISSWVENGFLDEDQTNLVKDILYAPKLHLIQGKMRRINEMVSRETFKARRDSHVSMLGSIKSDPISREPSEQNSTKYEDADERLLKKLAPDTESAVILVANVDALERPLTALVRLKQAQLLYPEIPDHPVPARFVFVLLNPHDNYYNETTGLGRALGALFSDEIFQKVAYNSMDKHTIADGIEEFLTQIVAIPPGKCTTDTRWEPKEEGVEIRHAGMLYADYDGDPFADEFDEKQLKAVASEHAPSIVRTGRCFGGLVEDVKTKAPWFASDFIDFFRGRLSQSIAATILIFFGNITNIITFGAVMERALHHQMAAIENILCGGLSGVIFGIFSGQPLNILSATGPTLVFEKILYDFCTANHWEFLPFRFWVGIWMAFFLIVLVATDSSALVGLITRFTEEAFATLISTVFIIQAFQKLYEISHDAPITRRPEEVLHSSCHCIIETPNGPNDTLIKNLSMGVTRCRELGGVPQGLQCFFKPDVYMFSVLLTFGTFFIAYKLNSFRRSPYLTSKMRNAISDFGVLIAIILMTLLTNAIGLEIPSLNVPSSLR